MNRSVHILAATCTLLLIQSAWAASVSAVKGQKVLINLEGDSLASGDEFYLINPATGKKTAIIKVSKVKGPKALGDILKGRATAGNTLQAKAASGSGSRPMSADVGSSGSRETSKASGFSKMLKDSWGVSLGYMMNKMDATVSFRDSLGATQKAPVSMSGTGFSLGGFYDYKLTDSLVGHVTGAYEQFNVTGTSSVTACTGSTTCDAKINYLSGYGLLKWYPVMGAYRFWVGGGGGFMMAMSKSSTALNESQISTNQVFTGALGTDIQMSRTSYIPITLQYNMFPASDTVKANSMILRFGWGWNL